MEAAKHCFVTEEMKIVAKKENVSEEFLLEIYSNDWDCSYV